VDKSEKQSGQKGSGGQEAESKIKIHDKHLYVLEKEKV